VIVCVRLLPDNLS